ncbi:LLM class flavin-dependent oxidoreductase [Plantactinospora soyae]|uniref:FMN-dependent oxidoreductase (Nitrilotriacetate monooxygenase family) n=1 Tax=Plantactinospora soyae TaxID=1544732 RepID=A0A927MC91_9ACTN|nr:LLM class flavin-dependent oxidoreductase [Plantactinospora soyae]MBE1491814.1 FMN-dependent oxidoreductase (nitrilotriacetate monooxygenase family) [Plantactinospora soyae]
MARRQLHLNAFLMTIGHHESAWRFPESSLTGTWDVAHYRHLAQVAERGRFDSVFFGDGPSLQGDIRYRPVGRLDPTVLLPALAAATERIGLVATASTTYNEPYNLARRFATIDHVSAGRAGWNIVTTAGRDAARNFGLDDVPEHRHRYERAAEFVDVCRKLWDSWADDFLLGDKANGRFAYGDRIRPIAHEGRFFRVQGPLNVPRTPQGYPLLVQAGSSEDGRQFAARYAEAVFTAQQTLAEGQAFYADLKARVAAEGRDPGLVKILPGIVPVIGTTEAQARERADELARLQVPAYGLRQLASLTGIELTEADLDSPLPEVGDVSAVQGMQSRFALVTDLARRENLTVRQLLARLGGGRGHRTFVGTPEQIADTIEEWFGSGAADGFNIMPPLLPSGLEEFVDHVVPVLQRRGLFRTEYTGRTLRDHYGLPRPVNQFQPPTAVPTPVS